MSKRRIMILVTSIVIALDQIIKKIMINKQITIIPNFLELSYTENIGAAFGIGNNKLFLIILITTIILVLILKFIKEREAEIEKHILIALNIVLAGGISNLIDRICRGYVIDYIKVNLFNFPNFNIADICITIGIFILILSRLKLMMKSESTEDK